MLTAVKLEGYGIEAVLDEQGEVWMPSRDIEIQLGLGEDSVRKKWASKSLKPLAQQALASGKKVEIKTVQWLDSEGRLNRSRLYHLDSVAVILAFESSQGNLAATQILAAGYCDSVRSLTYSKNGKTLTDSARDEYIKIRTKTKVTRRQLTDVLKQDCGFTDGHEYAQATLECYRRLGLLSQYQAWKNSNSRIPFRDTLETGEMMRLASLEEWLGRKAVVMGFQQALDMFF